MAEPPSGGASAARSKLDHLLRLLGAALLPVVHWFSSRWGVVQCKSGDPPKDAELVQVRGGTIPRCPVPHQPSPRGKCVPFGALTLSGVTMESLPPSSNTQLSLKWSNLDSILKSRDITLSTHVHLVKAVVFPVVMYGCESWTGKKADRCRIDAFELWCWRRLLRDPWPARRSNQSILKEISPGCSLEGLMLKLKPQYFGHLMRRVDSLEKTLGGSGRDWGQEEKGTTEDEMAGWHHRLDGHEFE